MKRDYSNFIDNAYSDKNVEPLNILMKNEIKKNNKRR